MDSNIPVPTVTTQGLTSLILPRRLCCSRPRGLICLPSFSPIAAPCQLLIREGSVSWPYNLTNNESVLRAKVDLCGYTNTMYTIEVTIRYHRGRAEGVPCLAD